MSQLPPCPKCHCVYTYENGSLAVCPECFFEWDSNQVAVEEVTDAETVNVLDANGNPLQNGDAVILIKDLPVKGSPKSLKAGTKVKNIRLVNGDHNIDCKIEGFGSMALKSIYVRKA